MTSDEALALFGQPHILWTSTDDLNALIGRLHLAGQALADEVRRYQAMRCETCKHNDYGDCARTLHVERSDMGTKFESWTQCETLGSGCRAWEVRDEA